MPASTDPRHSIDQIVSGKRAMQTFTLATLETDAGLMPAIGISGRFWRRQ
jgi:hypothetical protein